MSMVFALDGCIFVAAHGEDTAVARILGCLDSS